MILNEQIWGDSSTYRYIQSGTNYGTYKIADKLYGDILYANPALQFPFYEKSTYRWGMPSDCSAGHITSCMWYSDSGSIKTKIHEYVITGVTPFTLTAETGAAYSSFDGMRAYIETYDAYMHYPPYDKNQAVVESYSGTVTWSSIYVQPYSHRIAWDTYNGLWINDQAQCTKYEYNKNVWLVSATYCCDKGNYVDDHLSTGGTFGMYNGNLKPLISHMRSRYNSDVANGDSVQPSDYHICGAGISLFMVSNDIRIHTNPSVVPTTTPYYKPSDRWCAIWYNADLDVSTTFLINGAVGCGSNGVTNADTITDIAVPYQLGYTALPTQSTFFNNSTNPYAGSNQRAMAGCDAMSRASSKKQVYSDVSYHWDWYMRIDAVSYKLSDITTLPATSSNKISIYPALVIDNYDINAGDYFTACYNAVLHELSFYGLPLVASYDDARNAAWSVTQESIYIPEFDSHMITTGNFITLKKSYELDSTGQFDWGDIFAADAPVNVYDPSYQPTPEHGEDDFGDLDNKGSYRIFPTTLNCYALNATELTQFMYILNGLYLTDPDGNTKWNLDFKGTNPSEYILAAYATLYDAPLTSEKEDVKLGAVSFTEVSPNYQLYGVKNVEQFDCGSVFLAPYYGDFRDFAPYTSAELYLPLCGSVDIDIPYFLNHYINVVYWIDIYTMSCAASIYRDGTTLYKTISGSCGAQIPLLAPDLANYQNTVHQIEQQQKQNSMRVAASVIGTTLTAAGLAAAPETMGASVFIAGMGMGITQAVSAASGVQTAFDLNYQLEHIPRTHTEIGAASPQNNFCVGDILPKLFIKRAKMLPSYNANHYSHVVGNQCCIAGTIGSFSGYTVVGSCDLTGIQATQSELDQIRQLLQTGVYL